MVGVAPLPPDASKDFLEDACTPMTDGGESGTGMDLVGSLMGVTSALPRSRPLTYADLAAMPDDGHRYELVDGTLIVTPAPRISHQEVVGRLSALLWAAAPAGMRVLFAPVDVVLRPDTVLQPDLLVAPAADFTEANLPVPPALAVEVLSPSTRRIDLGTKRLAFEAAGVPSYWVIDPDEPSLTVFELEDASYRQVARVGGDQRWEATQPFPELVVPAALVES
jgi:Uma2 family endonuclease